VEPRRLGLSEIKSSQVSHPQKIFPQRRKDAKRRPLEARQRSASLRLCGRNGNSLVTFALCNRNDPVNSRHVEGLDTAVGPLNFELINLRRRAESEVQRHIVLRAI